MNGEQIGALDFFSIRLGIESVETQAVFAGKKTENHFQILAQFLGGARLVGIVSRGLNPSTSEAGAAFKTTDIVALPAVKTDRNALEPGHGLLGLDAHRRISLRGCLVILFNLLVGESHNSGKLL